MTEAEWLASAEPAPMLAYLLHGGKQVRPRLAHMSVGGHCERHPCCTDRRLRLLDDAFIERLDMNTPSLENATLSASTAALAAALLRDIFAPFQSVPRCECDPDVGLFTCRWCDEKWGWLTWNNGTVRTLAEQIYSERRFEDMGLLADMLEESGCADEAILGHCRQPYAVRYTFAGASGTHGGFASREAAEAEAAELREHFHGKATVWVEGPVFVRGDWVIDLLLGKE